MKLNEIGEFALIERLGTRLKTRSKVLLGIGDDGAILDSLHCPVITCDALMESVHFRRDWTSARDLGWKAVAVNVSDLAAMGADPVAIVLALGLPADLQIAWLEELYEGLEEAAAHYDLSIVGGDTTRAAGGVFLAVTAIGEVPANRLPLRRDGARPGDIVLVTGTLGDAAAALQLLLQPDSMAALNLADCEFLLSRHHRPQARLKAMRAAQNATIKYFQATKIGGVTAALDLSDGTAGDAAHLARRSGVTIEIEIVRLPLSDASRAAAEILNQSAEEWALRGGEDYELLLCVAPDDVETMIEAIEKSGVSATRIGVCVPLQEAPVVLLHPDGRREIAAKAWTHF